MSTSNSTTTPCRTVADPATDYLLSKLSPRLRLKIFKLALNDPDLELQKLKRPALLNVSQAIRAEALPIYRKQIDQALEVSRKCRDEKRQISEGVERFKVRRRGERHKRGGLQAFLQYEEAYESYRKDEKVAEKELGWIEQKMGKEAYEDGFA